MPYTRPSVNWMDNDSTYVVFDKPRSNLPSGPDHAYNNPRNDNAHRLLRNLISSGNYIASIPTQFSAKIYGNMTGDQTPEYTIWPRYANSSVSVTTAQPVVQVNCRTHSGIPSNISTLVQQVHGPGEVGSDNGSSVRTQYFPPA
jgi:hypothetical protein